MPIYDYKCQECGEVAEIYLNSVDGSRPIACPACGSEKMQKLISAFQMLQTEARAPGTTCCGRMERCEMPPCSLDDNCRR
jgi:putative FmdB family regulatory protein